MKSLKKIGVLFTAMLIMMSFTVHDFHTSTTKIEFDQQSNTLKITSKYFTEDLEKAVGVGSTSKGFKAAVKNYSSKHFALGIDGSKVKVDLLGVEPTDKATRVYCEVKNVSSVNTLDITNSMLVSSFSDQQNFIDLDINGSRKSVICTKSKVKTSVKFK